MELGDVPLESVDTSLYGFAGDVVHPLGQISLPLSLGSEPAQKTTIVCFLAVDMPSAYNLHEEHGASSLAALGILPCQTQEYRPTQHGYPRNQ
ncbi:UNVERIFIED_CONTAM: hypothetical protein Sangu_3011600 [Sesamum angustifolium]|uniref:Uncharacterized protein n=1 Tax=Sesamum angustifolium TaxID=2727405 RepID=A0AAW2KLM1_9LAMI